MKKVYNIICIIGVALLTSCSDFLDVKPIDKALEEDQYSTETGIISALNGLYRQMADAKLYGGHLSQTTVEAMGGVYSFPPTLFSDSQLSAELYHLAWGEYGSDLVKGRFADIWNTAYKTAFNINNFIKALQESQAIISPENKELILGEAYGLRAYLHFDLFRLFGPRYEERDDEKKILPYNNSTDIVLNHEGYEEDVYVTADKYFELLFDDICTAERLMASDPVITGEADDVLSKTLYSDSYKNRNRRMNYYAVKGLEARILQYMGNLDGAAEAAKEVTDQEERLFKWTSATNVVGKTDYSFFQEVIFGLDNLDMTKNYNSYFKQTNLNNVYGVDHDNLLFNIYADCGSNMEAVVDVRAKQWKRTDLEGSSGFSMQGVYRSNKFTVVYDANKIPALVNFQPLMRISEMHYIQAEAALANGDKAGAAEILNAILAQRGIPNTSSIYVTAQSNDLAFDRLILNEYYKEFYGEGQVYFYQKRKNLDARYLGCGTGMQDVDPKVYQLAIPQSETDV